MINGDRAIDLELRCERAVAHVTEILGYRTVVVVVGVAEVFLILTIEHLFKGFQRLVYRKLYISEVYKHDRNGYAAAMAYIGTALGNDLVDVSISSLALHQHCRSALSAPLRLLCHDAMRKQQGNDE